MKSLAKVVATFIGMAGLRLDLRSKHWSFVLWVFVFLGGTAAYLVWNSHPIDRKTALAYAAAVWVLYYVGNSVALCSGLRTWMIRRLGETAALRTYNTVLGLVFAQQAFSQGAFLNAYRGTLVDDTGILRIVGIGLILFGLTIKVWATYVSTLDIYYYNDMFLGRPVKEIQSAVVHGPYRWFKNPMYGVGNLQAYGSALVAGSWEGVLLCGFFHASIYAFYYLFERPFVVNTYFRDAETTA